MYKTGGMTIAYRLMIRSLSQNLASGLLHVVMSLSCPATAQHSGWYLSVGTLTLASMSGLSLALCLRLTGTEKASDVEPFQRLALSLVASPNKAICDKAL